MRRKGLSCIAFPLGLLLAATSSQAADRGFYAGIDLGLSKLDRTGVFDNAVTSSDAHSASWSVMFGYRFNPHFSLEAGYVDLGNHDATLEEICTAVCTGNSPHTRTSIDGFVANVVGTWPLSPNFRLTGSAGAIYRNVDYTYGGGSFTRKGTAWKLGVGGVFPINDRVELGVDLTHYLDVGIGLETPIPGSPHTVDDGDATVLTFGARWLF